MPSAKNLDQLQQLKNKLKDAKAIVLADYHGLPVNKQQELRQKVQAVSGEFTIAKNTLLKLAFKEQLQSLPSSLEQVLQGPTALLIAQEDEIGPIKALVQFSQENDLPQIKIGLLEDRLLTIDEVTDLAKLPGRLELQAKLINTLNAPISGFANVLSGNLRQLVLVINAIKDKAKDKTTSKQKSN
jgi:large subunit ribosomal protein L10